MTQSTIEAVARLKDAIRGRAQVDSRQGKILTVSCAEVACGDVLEVCCAVTPRTGRIQSLIDGSNGAAEGASAFVKITDLAHLLDLFALTNPVGVPSNGDAE